LDGIDLFNHGYYWEAHESWEAVWHAAGRKGWHADFLKSLIKLAAALVKAREGKPEGVRRHAQRAADLLSAIRNTTSSEEVMGLPLGALEAFAAAIAAEPERYVDIRPDRVVRLVDAEWIPAGLGFDRAGSGKEQIPREGNEENA
jgi:predicted metal-dependent hydrolase